MRPGFREFLPPPRFFFVNLPQPAGDRSRGPATLSRPPDTSIKPLIPTTSGGLSQGDCEARSRDLQRLVDEFVRTCTIGEGQESQGLLTILRLGRDAELL